MAMPVLLKAIRPHHLPMIWEALHKRFGFEIPAWKEKFEMAYKKQPRGMERVEFMLVFGVRQIDPVINQILGRPFAYSSFLKMVDELIRK